jgi:hypothetical protein
MNIFDGWKGRSMKRKKQLLSIPKILDYKTLLYIGANPQRLELLDIFYNAGYKIDVLEIFPANVEGLKEINRKEKIFNKIILGDVREIDETMTDRKYDIVCWWHGPEHVKKHYFAPTLRQLENLTIHITVLGCPWGKYPQGALYGNEYEKHESSLYPKDFRELGYNVKMIKKPNKRGSNILAWKIKN